MSFDADRVETVTVDSYGTLVDPSATDRALADRVEDPTPVSNLWRSRSLMYTMVANTVDFYQDFYEMNRDALQYALDVHDVDLSPDERDEVLSVYHELDVFEDVRDGVSRIREGGYPVYVVSNGSPEMLTSMVEHAEIDDLIVDTISADEIGTFKPASEIYRHAAARTGTGIDRIVHTAGPSFDVLGAKHAGAQAAWINREDAPWEDFADREPELTIETFHDLAEALGV
jgi:2-haloacid dehalogenase